MQTEYNGISQNQQLIFLFVCVFWFCFWFYLLLFLFQEVIFQLTYKTDTVGIHGWAVYSHTPCICKLFKNI